MNDKNNSKESLETINIIEKYFEGTEDESTVVFYDQSQVTEIDYEGKEIYYDDGETLSFNDIDIDYIKVFQVRELEMEDDISLYLKDVKKSIKSLEKYNTPNTKKLLVFSLNENFILNPYNLDDLSSIEFLNERYDSLKLFDLTLIKNPKI